MGLVYKHEKSLFIISAILSALVWGALIIGTFGVVLIYIILIYIFFLFGHSAFISNLKGNGVKIGPDQYPDLYNKLTENCKKIDLVTVPDAYILRTDVFNALATRFLGRNFVVLFSDVVDAFEDKPSAIDFYIGHELGHIHRKHLLWSGFLLPASILPLLGAALRRAEEYTCDRYGATCCENEEDIKIAISAIATGNTYWKIINIESYLKQITYTGDFWMSFQELTSDYPWLTKRMATAISFKTNKEIFHPSRHFLAWVLSIFVPRFGGGGGIVSLMMTIAIIGILAAVAIPSYNSYIRTAKIHNGMEMVVEVKQKIEEYAKEKNEWPENKTVVGISSRIGGKSAENLVVANGGIYITIVEGEELVFIPSYSEGVFTWDCTESTVKSNDLPIECR